MEGKAESLWNSEVIRKGRKVKALSFSMNGKMTSMPLLRVEATDLAEQTWGATIASYGCHFRPTVTVLATKTKSPFGKEPTPMPDTN